VALIPVARLLALLVIKHLEPLSGLPTAKFDQRV
jgi:hypothetical protein